MNKDNSLDGIKPIYIKKVFEQKNQKLAKIIPNFIFNYLKRVIHQDDINEFIKLHGNKEGIEFADGFLDFANISYEVKGIENLPKEGKYIFASNHPLGGPDGVILISFLGKKYNIKFPVNDILLNIKNLSSVFLPINKHGSQAKQAAIELNNAFESDNQIIIFPAGLVSRKQKGVIKDLEWKKTFINKAIRYQRDVIPMHISGRNSNFFYNLANLRKFLKVKSNIEMLYLPDELYKHKGNKFTITIGEPISYKKFDKSKTQAEWAHHVKDIVYSLNLEHSK